MTSEFWVVGVLVCGHWSIASEDEGDIQCFNSYESADNARIAALYDIRVVDAKPRRLAAWRWRE